LSHGCLDLDLAIGPGHSLGGRTFLVDPVSPGGFVQTCSDKCPNSASMSPQTHLRNGIAAKVVSFTVRSAQAAIKRPSNCQDIAIMAQMASRRWLHILVVQLKTVWRGFVFLCFLFSFFFWGGFAPNIGIVFSLLNICLQFSLLLRSVVWAPPVI
jgi:hypothetical protein